MNRKLKASLISVVITCVIICLAIDVWYLCVLLFGKDKIVVSTFYVNQLELADGSKVPIFELEYWANEDKSGYECFEIKTNYFMDETKANIYTQGMQYTSKSQNSSLDPLDHYSNYFTAGRAVGNRVYESHVKKQSAKNGFGMWRNYDVKEKVGNGWYNFYNAYNYESLNAEEFSKSTNPIGLNSFFRIQIGDEIYGMQLKGLESGATRISNQKFDSHYSTFGYDYVTQDWVYDFDWLAYQLYSSVKDVSGNFDNYCNFELGDLFFYYLRDENGVYSKDKTTHIGNELIDKVVINYLSVKVKTHSNGFTKSSDSMFGKYLGNNSFDLGVDYSQSDYFIGKTLIDCDTYSFDYFKITDNYYSAKLKQSFVEQYKEYRGQIALVVLIDKDILNSKDINFVGFAEDSGLQNWLVYSCNSVETINGERVVSEVSL